MEKDDELNLLKSHHATKAQDKSDEPVSKKEILQMQKSIDQVFIEDTLYNYILDLILATRNNELVKLGCSTSLGGTYVSLVTIGIG